MYSLEHKLYISQRAENQRNKEQNVGFVYSLQSFLFPLLFTYSAVSRCVSKQRWLSGGSLAEKNHSAPTSVGIDCSTMTVRQFLVMLIFRSMCFVVRNEMPTFAAESVRAFTTFEHTFFAFAIISRLAKSLGNSIGIKSTRIICEGLLRIWCAPPSISNAHAQGVVHSYRSSGVPFRGRPVLNAIRRAPRFFFCAFAD